MLKRERETFAIFELLMAFSLSSFANLTICKCFVYLSSMQIFKSACDLTLQEIRSQNEERSPLNPTFFVVDVEYRNRK